MIGKQESLFAPSVGMKNNSGTKIGIVGSEAAKFTSDTSVIAKQIIREILYSDFCYRGYYPIVVSGHCHLGGIDIYAEEVATELGLETRIFPPKNLNWSTGYKPRNLQIARESDVVYCITVKDYPPNYAGMRFSYCYHCGTNDHIKSGGCWTVKEAIKMGKKGEVIVI
jgi:hypothetical protein